MAKDNKSFFKTKNSWSDIKDQLLGCYLAPYFQKVLLTNHPIFYVDCFAGKGKFEDGKPGSPLIALQARNNSLSCTSLKTGHGQIDTCFIDLNYADDLKCNIAEFCYGVNKTQVVSGRYEEVIEGLLSNKSGTNVFLYIDPYGIRALDFALFTKFKSYGFKSFEMLINFNSFGFFRDACRAMKVDWKNDEALQDLDDLVEYEPTTISASRQSEDLLSTIAGGVYWKDIVADYTAGNINGYQAEKRLSNEYKIRLRKKYEYVLDLPIRLKPGQRPKYRMIHVCDHEDGCFLMAQNMQKRKSDLFINVQQNGQMSLFDCTPIITANFENELVSIKEIENKMREHLMRYQGDISITKLMATFVNDYGLLCEFNIVYNILEELMQQRSIEIIRFPAYTEKTGKPSSFWEEKKDKSVTIRRSKQ